MNFNDFFVAPSVAWHILKNNFFDTTSYLVSGDARIGLKYLSIYLALSIILYFVKIIFGKGKGNPKNLKQFLFPNKIYNHPSFHMDLKVLLAKAIINPITFTSFTILTIWSSKVVLENLERLFPQTWDKLEPSKIHFFFISIIGFLIFEFSQYVIHRFFHKVSFMWPFHSPHHSAEVLNPFTVNREHFVWDFIEDIIFYTFVGIGHGVIVWLMVGNVEIGKLFEYTLIFNILNAFVGNFYHSQFWISFGPLSYIFISPAMHQIHHSTDTKHRNKNFGYFLSIWDLIFGTIYVPKEKENLNFGIEKGVKNPHDTLLKFYFLPFKESWLVLKNKFVSLGFIKKPPFNPIFQKDGKLLTSKKVYKNKKTGSFQQAYKLK